LIKRRKSQPRNIALFEIPEVRVLQRQTRVGIPPADAACQGLKLRAARTYLPIMFYGKRFWSILVTRAGGGALLVPHRTTRQGQRRKAKTGNDSIV
jgi:hypothetical protein